ncbi:Uncharacterised protein [Klebsiella variicola]|uniref:Uncharacterized protein n=1 Tax=Klebsiella variicola TaxID=244366 RepID=A0A7H4MJK4_KLEVA|nr:Uncharacterised protein [Klebsiella variicola]
MPPARPAGSWRLPRPIALPVTTTSNDASDFTQTCRRIEATRRRSPGLPYNRWRHAGARCCVAATAREVPLPSGRPARGNQSPPRRQRLRRVDQAPAVIAEKQRFQHHHRMAKQRHPPGRREGQSGWRSAGGETSPAHQDRGEDGASVTARFGKHGLIVIGNNLRCKSDKCG